MKTGRPRKCVIEREGDIGTAKSHHQTSASSRKLHKETALQMLWYLTSPTWSWETMCFLV